MAELLPAWITDLHPVRPRFETPQERAQQWLADAHADAEGEKRLRDRFLKSARRFGCGADAIRRRGHELEGLGSVAWTRMALSHMSAGGRNDIYLELADSVLDRLYPEGSPAALSPPGDLIHVTCTGIGAPSPAQKLVARRGWHETTQVIHAYQMGCCASIPAVRLGLGLLGRDASSRVDLLHTEFCTLHLNPQDHSPEEWVAQSLFADGFIRYSLQSELRSGQDGLAVIRVRERILPGSVDAMTWSLRDWGMRMHLAREIPELIRSGVGRFVRDLFDESGLDPEIDRGRMVWAIHPGGPRILDQVADGLGIDPRQVRWSREVLADCGNMSSATLPHIWERILRDPEVASGTPVVSLAFGPGLTVCGGVFVKRGREGTPP